MTNWLIICQQQYSENTPEYGCGDYPDQIDYIRCVVDADTPHKAMAAAKKLYPRLRFGRFGAALLRADDHHAKLYIKPADKRLGPNARACHNVWLATLEGVR